MSSDVIPDSIPPPCSSLVMQRLRQATGALHARLDRRLDGGKAFADPTRRDELALRFARLLRPAEAALSPWLVAVDGLDLQGRFRARGALPADGASGQAENPFPLPNGKASALGMLYVLEGSTLGGRSIRRRVEASGNDAPSLSFLDPYGEAAGARWRAFLAVLARELRDEAATVAACGGAVAAFEHSERILCGAAP